MTEPFERLGAALTGRYVLERELGQGGMATVFLAQDIKHDRKVALKVLKPELAAVLGAERFVVEIKTTAALQHPHILPLFDSGTADGFLFYVMPFVEGETLRDKLNRERQLSVDDAVRIAVEVADALDYAHRHGVIHRDIKPENILLHDGRPMVADFGIALAVSAAAGGRMTETGLSLGTPYYMSPEQATGERTITGRSDIYSLASVLYEMLSGEPPHMGNAAQQIIMKIIGDTPRPVTELRKAVPPHVAAVVAKALEKIPADRFDTAKAFGEALQRPGSGSFTVGTTASRAVSGPLAVPPSRLAAVPLWMAFTALALAVVVGAAGWAMLAPEPVAPPLSVSRFRLQLPKDAEPAGARGSTVALSPDGSRMVYVGTGNGRQQLYTRSMSQLDPVAIPGTEGSALPFFSPNGQWIGFRQNDRLMKMPADGGPALPMVASLGLVEGASWTERDTIVFSTNGELREVPASGGSVRVVAHPDSSRHEEFFWPEVLPGDRHVLFTVYAGSVAKLAVLDRSTGDIKRLEQLGGYPRYVSPGFVMLSGLSRAVAAVPFDLKTLSVTGPLVTFAEANAGDDGDANLAVSRTGLIVFQPSGAITRTRVVLADRSGGLRDLTTVPARYGGLRVSPDGKRVAMDIVNDNLTAIDIWIYDIERRVPTRLTTDTVSAAPFWSADGRRVVYSRISGQFLVPKGSALYSLPADGGASPQQVLGTAGLWTAGAQLPGVPAMLISGTTDVRAPGSIWQLTGDSTAQPVNMTPGAGAKSEPSISPDGRFFAYQSNESGRNEVYVRSMANAEIRRQVSSDGGSFPRWSRTGREIFFRSGQNNTRMMAAEIRTTPTLQVGATTHLFDGPGGAFDPMPDGRSFVLLQTVESQDAAFVVVLNWFDELRQSATRSGKR